MTLNCDTCGKSFPNNTSLYMHRQRAHTLPPTLALVKHDHDDGMISDTPQEPKNQPFDEALDNIPLSDRRKKRKHEPDQKLKLDYKVLYDECIEEKEKMRIKLTEQVDEVKRGCRQELNNALLKYSEDREKLIKLKNDEMFQLKNKLTDLETLKDVECEEKLKKLAEKHANDVRVLEKNQEKQLSDLENDCKEKLKLLTDQIKALEEDDRDLSSLNRAIFNCVTMEELYKIQQLVKNHQLEEVVENHLKTLQNLFLSLSHGVLPICQPQRDRVTDSQRRLVENMQTSSKVTVKRLMKNNRADIVNLFSIIKDSLKMARNSFNSFGSSSL
jgi:hypothetical protein